MKKGFTLIELLAVIVILAAIALIVTPLVLSTINTSKEETYKRSIDMYARAIKTATSLYDLSDDSGESVTVEKLKSLNMLKYEGSKVECETEIIKEDGSVYLSNCKVDGKLINYTYGEYDEKSNIKKYYSWARSISKGDSLSSITDLKTDLSQLNRQNEPFYIMVESEDEQNVSAAYVCLKRSDNEPEYCLKDPNVSKTAFDENKGILDSAFPGKCTLDDNSGLCDSNSNCRYHCETGDDGIWANEFSTGLAQISDFDWFCRIVDGKAECSDW